MKTISFVRMPIARQFVVVSMSIITIILAGVMVYMIRDSLASKDVQSEVLAAGYAGGVIEKVDRNFYERFGDVQAFAFNSLARECVQKDTATAGIKTFMNTMVGYYVLYDLMIVCNEYGRIMAVNDVDKNGKKIMTDFLVGKNVSDQDWFRACISGDGPAGGAWYSDFTLNGDVTSIYGRSGWGMAFAAPIKDDSGETRGVWYNFANWQEVTGGIRKESEDMLKALNPGAFILVTDNKDRVIDTNEEDALLKTKVSEAGFESGTAFYYEGKNISRQNYISADKKGAGAYTYKGNGWNAITFVPKASFNLSYMIDNMSGFLIGILVVLILSALVIHTLSKAISKSINTLKINVEDLSKGELPDIREAGMQNEIGDMTRAIKVLVQGMRGTAQFAEQIGKGNFKSEYKALSGSDVLGRSLLAMRDNLIVLESEDQKRKWANEGFALFGEILRVHQSDLKDLSETLIVNLSKYLRSNQGMFYILNSSDTANPFLELTAAYAWNRKKYLQARISKGEGLTGQCWQEQELIVIRSVPEEFIKITSGIGEALPRNVVYLPLKSAEEIHGVIELASFEEFEPYQLDFLVKLAESIAATISSVRINERTRVLLTQAQQQAEELRAQEEEMRQNMEELSATQEEMSRKEMEYLKRINELEKRTAVTVD